VGGSQGAAHLNAVVPFALARCASLELDVRHQTGAKGLEAAQRHYQEAGYPQGGYPQGGYPQGGYPQAGRRAQLQAFIDDIASAYGWADLVICRAGALTVSELAAAGVASILVPFPAATDDHQTRNAAVLVEAGAAIMIAQRELTAERLAEELHRLCAGRGKLLSMAERARQLAKPNAASELADACVALARASGIGGVA